MEIDLGEAWKGAESGKELSKGRDPVRLGEEGRDLISLEEE